MSAVPDFYVVALAAGVIALFAAYFWHVGARFVGTARLLAAWLDTSSERQRAQIEFERVHGRPPLWLRAVRAVMVTIVICGAAALLWYRL